MSLSIQGRGWGGDSLVCCHISELSESWVYLLELISDASETQGPKRIREVMRIRTQGQKGPIFPL